jgi:soluble lytic murein transglycosylase
VYAGSHHRRHPRTDLEVRLPRRPETLRGTIAIVAPAALLAVGLVAGQLRSSEWNWRSPLLSEIQDLTALEPMRALPRTEAVIATVEAQRQMEVGRPWAAWQALNGHLDVPGPAGIAANLLAAEAASRFGGWRNVRTVLVDRSWLADYAGGDGLFLLARAEEELGNVGPAARVYERYLAVPGAQQKGVARARYAALLSRLGQHQEAAAAFAAAAGDIPEVSDWLRVLQVDQLVAAGEPTVTELATSMSGGSAPVRLRRVQVEAQAWTAAAQTERAINRLEWEARILSAEGARLEAATLHLDRARLLLGSTQPAEGRALLRQVAAEPALPASIRLEAAQKLGELNGRSADEELARSEAFAAAGRPGVAARALRLALENGAPDGGERRLRLAHLLYQERDFGPARVAFLRAAELLDDRELKADAELHAARSLFRQGGNARTQQTAKQNALNEFRRLVDRYPGTPAAGTALFLLGDEAPTNQAGIAFYRRAAAVVRSPDAQEALFRVGDRSLRLNDTAAAIRAWEEYVARYPRGDQTARVAYETGKLHEGAGRRSNARAMYTAAMIAEPTSYWAVRAGERLGTNPLDRVLAEPRPWIGLASEPADAAAVLARLDRLEELGLTEAREAEYQAALRAFESRPLAMLVLAEGIRDRDQPVEAIRLGRRLLQDRGGEWDERTLKLVYLFPYRDLIVAESRRAGIDPYLYAALVRQESTFRPAVKSRVGATGLGQIMPATGQWLAPQVGIRQFDVALLEVPEVNVRMGTRYLGDLLQRYSGSVDLALAGYNAGPARADRWRREFNYGRDTDAFRAAIPFDETRNYVMIVSRNAAMYQRLYGPAAGGRAAQGD